MNKYVLAIILLFFCCLEMFASSNFSAMNQRISPAVLLKSYKDISSRPFSVNKLKKQANNLTEKDRSILLKYINGAVKGEDTFLLINGCLRGNLNLYIPKKDITKPLNMRLKLYSDQLSEVISKGRLPQNTLLYYGIDDKTFSSYFNDKSITEILNKNPKEENLKNLKSKLVNKTYTEKGFMLASYDKNYTPKTSVIFCIKAPKNLQALLLDGSTGKKQKQVIIKKGYTWKVTDVKLSYDKNSKKYFYEIITKIVL